jgi:hypothetical protein
MGNIQGYGAFRPSNNTKEKSNEDKKKEQTELEKALEHKKTELYTILDIYKYHINVAILEQSFKLKNETLIENITDTLKNQDEKIKKNDEKYSSEMRNYKHISNVLHERKNINLILFYITVLVVLGLIGTTLWAILTK